MSRAIFVGSLGSGKKKKGDTCNYGTRVLEERMGYLENDSIELNRIERLRRQIATTADFIDLTSSNPTHQSHLFPAEILSKASGQYWSKRRYDPDPRGLPAARERIGHYYAHNRNDRNLQDDQFFLTASTSEAYSLLFSLLTNPGDNILGPSVTYPLFEHLAAIHHVELRAYDLIETDNAWTISEDSIRVQADEKTRAVLIISPHNPTGMVVHKPVSALTELSIPVICDEVFATFTYAATTVPTFTSLHPELPVFLLNGLSKMFALPDLKLGWIAMNKRALTEYGERFEFLNDTFLGCSSLIQAMLPTLFEEGVDFVAKMHQQIRNNISMTLEKLQQVPRLHCIAPDGGYNLFPRLSVDLDDEAFCLSLLEKDHLLVHPGYFYNEIDHTRFMISCLTEPQKLAEGTDRLVQALARF